jgi:hypothetical protein
MVTKEERLLKLEHDAWLAKAQALTNAANVDYIAMMSGIDIQTEEVLENESEV